MRSISKAARPTISHFIYFSPFQLQSTASVPERLLRATWVLLLWLMWLVAAVRESTLFVTEMVLGLARHYEAIFDLDVSSLKLQTCYISCFFKIHIDECTT